MAKPYDEKRVLSYKLYQLVNFLRKKHQVQTIAGSLGMQGQDLTKLKHVYKNRKYSKKVEEIEDAIESLIDIYSLTVLENGVEEKEEEAIGLPLFLVRYSTSKERNLKSSFKFEYYYLDGAEIPKTQKGILEIKKKNKQASLTIFNSKKKPNSLYTGKVSSFLESEKFAILFNKHVDLVTNYNSEGPLSFCSFNGNFENEDSKYFIGVFATSLRLVASGVVVLKRLGNENTVDSFLKSDVVSIIQSLIYNRRFDTDTKLLKSLKKKAEDIHNEAKSLRGVYEGYALDSQDNLLIQKLVFEFYDTGRVKFKSLARQNGRQGRIVDIIGERSLVIQFDYTRENNYHNVKIILDLKRASNKGYKDTILGVYGGVESTRRDPMAGRIILFRIKDKTYNEIEIDTFPIDNEEKISMLFKKENVGGILNKFFRGELDHFCDPPYIIEVCKFLKT